MKATLMLEVLFFNLVRLAIFTFKELTASPMPQVLIFSLKRPSIFATKDSRARES